MPQITADHFARALRDRSQGSVFFFHGDEEHLREAAVSRVVAAYLDDATRDFNFDQLRGAEVDPETLASLLATPPMMAEWRVVVLRDAQGLTPKGREAVEALVKAPPQGLALAVTAAIPQGSKAKFYDELKRLCLSMEFGAMGADEAPGWVMEHGRETHGVEVEPDAARALVGAIGVDLGTLAAEVRKLASYVHDRKRVTVDDVRAVGGVLPRQDRWAWFDLVAEKRYRQALDTLPILLEAGESGVALVIGISAQLLRVGLVCAGGQGALERELKPYQKWMARRIAPLAKRWTTEGIDAALAELLRTDRLLKTASLTDRQAIEELILRLWALESSGRSAA